MDTFGEQVNGAPNGNTAPSWSSRYDPGTRFTAHFTCFTSTKVHILTQKPLPDEAEMRVRNLIADTERMLAGLSALSGTSTQKPSEGVSV